MAVTTVNTMCSAVWIGTILLNKILRTELGPKVSQATLCTKIPESLVLITSLRGSDGQCQIKEGSRNKNRDWNRHPRENQLNLPRQITLWSSTSADGDYIPYNFALHSVTDHLRQI